jgi:phosphinothricin acetyltransferase
MIFRNATLQDLPAIVDIYNSTIPGRMVTADTEPITVESRVKWFEDHTPDKRPLWVVYDDADNLIGWVSFKSFYGRPAYQGTIELAIYLHPSVRGKGYGQTILEYALERCPSLGVKTVLGFIFAHNEPSLKLFRKLGFEDWALLPNIAQLDDTERSLIIVGKRVTQ